MLPLHMFVRGIDAAPTDASFAAPRGRLFAAFVFFLMYGIT
jgi:hypothetical protein